MSENILVVEYEPRYTDRVRQALAGQPFTTTFAKDGEEAIRALDGEQPRLIVLSSVVPKVSTTDLIRTIRGRKQLQQIPILLTVSGYNGKSPAADAQRVGASDILPKPYSETEFLGKVQQILGIAAAPQLTSNEIFGDLLKEDAPVKKTTTSRAMGDVDKMLADTLSGVMPQKRTPTAAGTAPTPAVPPKPRPQSDADKRLEDTLSGLEKSARMSTGSGNVPRPAESVAAIPVPAAAPVPTPVPPPKEAARVEVPDRVPVAQPILQATPPAKAEEEGEPTDGVKFGQYVLLEKIATGGMAEVWKARMRGVEGFQKIVAIKKILPHLSDNQEFIEMFVDEAKLAAQLNHNNIIHIYDLGKIQNSYYIAMEYIDGFDLKTILRRGEEHHQPMGVELALFVASKVGAALDYAHRKKDFEEKEMGLVHRDVSPQNVLISQEGDIKLCDFGIAKAASKASHTQAGALKGKLQYMSPEQAWGKHVDRRSDVFALAAVLFEMLTGRKLFAGDNEISILEQVREARIQPPSLYNDEVTTEIDRIVLKGLQKDPDSRYQTAGEMARELDAVLYSFRPTPTSADLAIYMHRISAPVVETEGYNFEEQHERDAPQHTPSVPVMAPGAIGTASRLSPVSPPATLPVMAPAAVPVSAPAPVTPPAPIEPVRHEPLSFEEPEKKKAPVAMIAAIAVLLIGGAAAAYFLTSKSDAPTVTTAATTASVPAASPAGVAPAVASADPALTATTMTGAPLTATTGTLDPSLVDAEVQKRIAAERARLEALARQQAAAQQPAQPVAARSQPVVPAARPAEPTPQTPEPVEEARTATQAPAQPAPATATQAATPAPAQPAVQRAREGDLIQPGTPGLVPPRILKRGSVSYPNMARAQRVQGTVITNVLVNERGQVIDVKIIRGVNRAVGLNEAAEQTMRSSSFAAGMKDGVRVKAWLTVPVEFKL